MRGFSGTDERRSATADLLRLIDSVPSGVAVVDSAGVIALANRQIEREFGYPRDELIGRAIDTLISDSSAADHENARGVMTLDTSAAVGRTFVGRQRDGSECPVDVELHPLATANDSSLFAVIVDLMTPEDVERKKTTIKMLEVHALVEGLAGEMLMARRRADRLKSQVEETIRFERLVADVSVQFINLPIDRINDAVLDALRHIGEMLNLDRCTFFQIESDGSAVSPIGWHRQEFPPAPAPVVVKDTFPWVHRAVQSGRVVCFSSVDEIPDEMTREGYQSLGIRSSVTVPLSVMGRIVGGVGFNMLRAERSWSPEVVQHLTLFATAFGNLLSRSEKQQALETALAEVERLRDRLQAENVYLRREVSDRFGNRGAIVGETPQVQRALALVEQVAATNSTVLLLGETGTGKELFASRIHELSARRERMMVRVNCSAIPVTLVESELFGAEKGAFTGAVAQHVGRFEVANHSTIFLDEIGDLPLDIQVKLLRVLEERQIERLGNPRPIRVDTRIIAATHRNLEQRIAEGAFREDLFYRLNVFPIQIPPLRERADDIPLLVWRFVDEFSKVFGKRVDGVSRENMTALQRYSWPGNIRELRNAVERAMILAKGPRLNIPVPMAQVAITPRSLKLTDVEREHIRRVLQAAGWRIRGTGGAADRLGMRPTTLETRMAKLGLARPKAS
jgi:PAS domain S-box-containing protein